MLIRSSLQLAKCFIGGRYTALNNCVRYGTKPNPKIKDPAVRRRQYITAACCVAGGAFVVGVTFTTVPIGQMLCRVSLFLNSLTVVDFI